MISIVLQYLPYKIGRTTVTDNISASHYVGNTNHKYCSRKNSRYRNVIINGYCYTNDRKRGNKTYMKCVLYSNGCRTRITLMDGELITPVPDHPTHDVQHSEIYVHVSKQSLTTLDRYFVTTKLVYTMQSLIHGPTQHCEDVISTTRRHYGDIYSMWTWYQSTK